MTCVVDVDEGTIEWRKNDKSQGIAYKGVEFEGPVFPAVSIYCSGNAVRIDNLVRVNEG